MIQVLVDIVLHFKYKQVVGWQILIVQHLGIQMMCSVWYVIRGYMWLAITSDWR